MELHRNYVVGVRLAALLTLLTWAVFANASNQSLTPSQEVANCAVETKNQGAQEAPPSFAINVHGHHFVTVSDIEQGAYFFSGLTADFATQNPQIDLSTPQAIADRVDVYLPAVGALDLIPLNVMRGSAAGYYFYYPFTEENPRLRWESPAFRGVIRTDLARRQLAGSSFVKDLIKGYYAKRAKATDPLVPKYRVRFNSPDFDLVIRSIASGLRRAVDPKTKKPKLDANGRPYLTSETWMRPEVVDLYRQLQRQGKVITTEVWLPGNTDSGEILAGAALALNHNGVISGESLYINHSPGPDGKPIGYNAGKLAFLSFLDLMDRNGVKWTDCQTVNNTAGQAGAVYLTRREYMAQLNRTMEDPPNIIIPKGDYEPRFEYWKNGPE